MVKIIGILATLLFYYSEINAEIIDYQHGEAATKRNEIFPGNFSFEAQPRAKLTTGFPEDVRDPSKKSVIKAVVALNNDLDQWVVESHRAKTISNDEEINQNEKKESEINKPRKKKKHHNNSAKLKSIRDGERVVKETDLVDKKHQKVKNGNKGIKDTDKNNKHKHHKDKDNKPIEKSMYHVNDASILNTTRLWYRGMSDERKNDDVKKNKEIADKHKKKHSKKSKQVDKSKDHIRMAKVLKQSLPSSKDLKVQPGTTTIKFLTSTSTPQPQSKPVREGVVDRTMYKRKVSLRSRINTTGEKIRKLRQQLGSGEGGAEGGEGAGGDGGGHAGGEGSHGDGGGHGGDHGGGGGHGDGGVRPKHNAHDKHGNNKKVKENKYPSHLSPYAVQAQMEALMKEFPKVNATVTKFARTIEYNDMVLITVTDKKGSERYSRAKDSKYIDDAPEKKIIFIVHGLTVMGMKSMTSLVKMSQLKLLFTYYFKHLDKFDFYIMPLANPDGYSASRSFNRPVWNKNLSPQSVCPGVFVDRNFDIGWNATNEISSCSQLYPGATPFSEVESKAVRDVFHYFSHKILAYIHVHAGTFDEKVFKGDAILYPRGYTETQSDDDKYIDLKGEIDEAMKNASFRVISVSVETLANWYGVISGSSVDYAASVFGIPYALEFVMQIYDTESLNNNALTQIWSRLIDTTLNNMWKSLHHASEERRLH